MYREREREREGERERVDLELVLHSSRLIILGGVLIHFSRHARNHCFGIQ